MIESIAIVGAIASIIGLLLPAKGWKAKITHIIYGLVIVLLSIGYVNYDRKLDRINAVERSAKRLIEGRSHNFTNAGYIQAVLTLLEKYQDVHPDAYARAKEICVAHDCNMSEYKKEGVEALRHSWGLIELAYQIDGILQGLIAINTDS